MPVYAVLPRSGKKDGKITDRNGEALSGRIFPEQGRIGLVHPEELPARFVSTAMAAFQAIIGKGKKKE
mgnify:CR=1 FL=1